MLQHLDLKVFELPVLAKSFAGTVARAFVSLLSWGKHKLWQPWHAQV
jgi:hypothetical protein